MNLTNVKINNELYGYMIMLNEFIYRDIFFDTIISVRDLLNDVELLKTNPTIEGLEQVIPTLLKVEEQLDNLPFVLKQQKRIISEVRISISRYLRLWKSANLGKRLK